MKHISLQLKGHLEDQMRSCKVKILCSFTSELLAKPTNAHHYSLIGYLGFSNSFGIPEHNNAFRVRVCPPGFPWSKRDAELFLLILPGDLSPHPAGEWDYCLHSEMGQAASHTHVHLLGKLCLPRDLVHLLHCPKYAGQHPFRDQDHLLHWVLPSILLLFLTGYNGVFLLISYGL